MGKRKLESPDPTGPVSAGTLDEHLAAVEAKESIPRIRRHHELRPAVPSVSPAPIINDKGTPVYTIDDDDDDEIPSKALPTIKKELATSKRARQNRDAQRAFRERKAGHMQELEDKVNRLQAVSTAYKGLQIENHNLRVYTEDLQRVLIRAGVDVPQPPATLMIPTHPPAPTEAGAAESARIARLSAGGIYARATSAEVEEISNGAIRQRDDAAGRSQADGQGTTNGTPHANIEPRLLDPPPQQQTSVQYIRLGSAAVV